MSHSAQVAGSRSVARFRTNPMETLVRRLGATSGLACVVAAALSLGCSGGIAGPGAFCSADLLPPAGTSGFYREYQDDFDKCRRGSPFPFQGKQDPQPGIN